MGKKNHLKKLGDESLLAIVERLQKKLSYEHTLNQLTVEQSQDNLMASRILHAKYDFMYREARERQAHSTRAESVITR